MVAVAAAAVVVVIEVGHEAGLILPHAGGDPPHILQTGAHQGAAPGLDLAHPMSAIGDKTEIRPISPSQTFPVAKYSVVSLNLDFCSFFTAVAKKN